MAESLPVEHTAKTVVAERILIVDDDRVSAALAARTLEREGYDCVVAQDAEHAWKLLGPDVALVLLDVMMPGKSGLEVLQRMQVDPLLASIPVLLATSLTDPAIHIRGLALGAQDILTKPLEREDLLRHVREATSASKEILGTMQTRLDLLEETMASELPEELSEVLGGAQAESALAPTSAIRRLIAEREVLYRRLDAGNRLLSAILRMHQMTGAGLAIDRVASGIIELAEKVLGSSQAVVWIPDGALLLPLAAVTSEPILPLRRDGQSLPARVCREWSTLEEDEVLEGERWMHQPLSVASGGVGVLSLRVPAKRPPSRTLSALYCAEAATALDASLRLGAAQSEALTDELTGLLNRRGLDRQLAALLDRARRADGTLSLLFLDLDHFKNVNDELGHERGDEILRLVSATLQSLVRPGDLVGRYGGDEFVLVLPGEDTTSALRVAERVREGIARAMEGEPLGDAITVTIGVSDLDPTRTRTNDLIDAADKAMLAGKRSGGNRVHAAGGDPAEISEPAAGSDPADAAEPAVGDASASRAIRVLLRALAGHDPSSYQHSVAVGALAARVARRLGCPPRLIREAGQAGLLHDVGKLYLPLEILRGSSPLTSEERVVVDQHTLTGGTLVESIPEIKHLGHHVRTSQEHFDGCGYPRGLAGDAISLVGRIVSVADAYHAMVSDRPYDPPRPPHAVAAELRRCAGTQFDPQVVDALFALLGWE